MATVNYYMNPTTGDDAWDGTSPTFVSGTTGPKEHISAMAAVLTDPITDEVIFNLAGTIASPEIYLEPTAKISLAGLRFQGSGANLTIRPLIWNQPNYVAGGDPLMALSEKWGISPPFNPSGIREIVVAEFVFQAIKVGQGSGLFIMQALRDHGGVDVRVS